MLSRNFQGLAWHDQVRGKQTNQQTNQNTKLLYLREYLELIIRRDEKKEDFITGRPLHAQMRELLLKELIRGQMCYILNLNNGFKAK